MKFVLAKMLFGLVCFAISLSDSFACCANEPTALRCEWIEYNVTFREDLADAFEKELPRSRIDDTTTEMHLKFMKVLTNAKVMRKRYTAVVPFRSGTPLQASVETPTEEFCVNISTSQKEGETILAVETRVKGESISSFSSFDILLNRGPAFISFYIGKNERTTMEDGSLVKRSGLRFVTIERLYK